MEPSSLIFLVIIGIWAAYFVQYWVRRREHLATIRSVDAFSETMRVLQRRVPLPAVDTDTQAPRTYAVSPARAMRPQVTVKRAEASVGQRDRATAATSTAAMPPMASRPDTSFAAELESESATMSPSRAIRGIVLLVGLLGTVVFGILALVGVLLAWAPLVPLVMAVVGFAWLRAGVQGEIRARHEAHRRAHRAAVRAESRPAARPAREEPAMAGHNVQQAAPEHETERRVGQEVVAEAPTEMPFDVSAETSTPAPVESEIAPSPAETVAEQPVARQEIGVLEVDDDDIPLTWDPRPVPRPTYTMKARAAERPAPAEVEPEAEAEHPAYDEVPQRRIVGG